jgi:hypothetical protein
LFLTQALYFLRVLDYHTALGVVGYKISERVCAPTLNLAFKADNMMLNIDFFILVQNIDSIDPQIVVDDSLFLLASYQRAPLFKGSDSNKAPSVSDEGIRHVYMHQHLHFLMQHHAKLALWYSSSSFDFLEVFVNRRPILKCFLWLHC